MDKIHFWPALLIFLPLFLLVKADDGTRKLSNLFNCSTDGDITRIIGIEAKGGNDTLYHIWSSIGSFVITTIRVENGTKLMHDCSSLISHSPTGGLTFSTPPLYSFTLVFTKIIEFNDVHDTGILPQNMTFNNLTNFLDLKWQKPTFLANNEDHFSVMFAIDESDSTFHDNTVQIKLSTLVSEERAETLPRLFLKADSVAVDFVLNNVSVHNTESRFGLQFYILNSNNSKAYGLDTKSQIDDEFTPGVFKMINVVSGNIESGFLQWKPTIYTSEDHKHDSSTGMQYNPLFYDDSDVNLLEASLAYSLYGQIENDTQAMNVTFGMSRDKFYESTKYSSWTFTLGYGTPPEDQLSSLIIIVIAVGLGIPVLVLLGGVIFIIVRRYRVQNDDLLLNQ